MRVLIEGRVQGVFFRQSAQEEARRLRLLGWVRNREDGKVEAVAEGLNDAVQSFIEWCRHGPPTAQVVGVEVTESADSETFSTFSVVR